MARKPSDGSSAEETLLTYGPEIAPSPVIDWSPDGRYLSHAVSIPIRGAGKIGFCLRLARANRLRIPHLCFELIANLDSICGGHGQGLTAATLQS